MEKKEYKEYDYILVLDFEAQCQNGADLECQEIIEFPVLIIDVKQQKLLENFFHYYIRPVKMPVLTEFCKELIGIEQDWVDKGILLEEALVLFDKFLEENKLLSSSFIIATCGDWDISTCLRKECTYKEIELKDYLCKWINVKKLYESFYNEPKGGMKEMLEKMNLTLDGRHHSGIDDSRNIAKIVLHLIKSGMQVTNKFEMKNKILKEREREEHKKSDKVENKQKQQKNHTPPLLSNLNK
jgi:inhibitor of KinA sporulation pathway (predicted exonuclease)